MNYKRKIFIVCLTVAMCVSILPLFTSAEEVFSLGETYQFTPAGDISIPYQANGYFLGDIYFEGQDKLNDLDVVSVDISVQVREADVPSNRTYDIAFGVICNGFYPTGDQQIPIYYDSIFYQVSQDTIRGDGASSYFIVQVATEVDGEVVMLDAYATNIDKVLFTPIGFADENIPYNYIYLVTWFTEYSEYNNPYLPIAKDYMSNMSKFTSVLINEFTELFRHDAYWGIIVIMFAFSIGGCVLLILRRFFRR